MPVKACKNRRQRGNATVEAALVVLPLFLFIIGIINVSMAYFLVDLLQDRAQLAIRETSLHPTNSSTAVNLVLYGTMAAPSPAPSEGFLGLTSGNVSVVRLGTGTPEDRVQLTITGYRLPFFIPGIPNTVYGAPIVETSFVETP